MAGAHCTVFSFLTSFHHPKTRRTYPLLLGSSIPAPNPSRITHRKNYLRPKILKTLNHPFELTIPLLPQELPRQSSTLILSPEEYDEGTHGIDEQSGESENLVVSETTGEYRGVDGKLSARSILKYGAYLVGVFVFQTICSVWIMNGRTKQKARDLEINEKGKRNFLINWIRMAKGAANVSKVFRVDDQLELERKIEKIKLMAWEARRVEEKKKEEVADPESCGASADSSRELGIKKEVNARLEKLQNKINSDRDRSAMSQVDKLNSNRASINVNQGNGKLMFKKKLRYRSSSSTKPAKSTKGFQGIRDRRAPNSRKRDLAKTGTAQENRRDATDHAQIFCED